jgi:hypothetical protein
MEQVEFEVEQLKVVVYTNITNSKDEMVEFNRSMLHIPKSPDDETNTKMTLANIPFFTSEIEYPIAILNYMNYHDRVNFFFNQKYFIDILRPYYKSKQEVTEEDPDFVPPTENKKTEENKEDESYNTDDAEDDTSTVTALSEDSVEERTKGGAGESSNNTGESSNNTGESSNNTGESSNNTGESSIKTDYTDWGAIIFGPEIIDEDTGTKYYADEKYEERERITRKNIKTMLEILFPTKFPVINDVQTSYEYIQNQKSTRPLWFNPFHTHYFSYLTIGGKIYTVKKTVWLNDILNHPVYQKIFIEYRKLKKWADDKGYNMNDDDAFHPNKIFTSNLDKTKLFKESTQPIPFRKFKNTMLGFIEPLRNSSNTYLQKLINVVTNKVKDSGSPEQFYKLLDNIYDTYINSKKEEEIEKDEEDSYYVPQEEDENQKKAVNKKETFKKEDKYSSINAFINTGISYINMGESNKPTREVYFMIDLIDGEINDKNKSSIYCPYMGDSLGNKLEYLINNRNVTDKNDWAVDKEREIFSLSNMEESGTEYTQKLEESPSNPSKNVGYKQLDQQTLSTNEISVSTEVSNNFSTYILKVEKDKPDEVENIIKKLKLKYMDSIITSIDKSRLLDSMQRLSDLSNKLVGAIIKWSKDIHVQIPGVTELLITIKNDINSQNELNAAKKKRYSVEMFDTTGQEKIKIDRDTDINNLLLLIVGKVQKHEANKRRTTSGGTKKQRTRSKKNTRRRRK